MKVLAIIFGLLLILPGLCFLGFGFVFTTSAGMQQFGAIELFIGAIITAAAVGLLISGSK